MQLLRLTAGLCLLLSLAGCAAAPAPTSIPAAEPSAAAPTTAEMPTVYPGPPTQPGKSQPASANAPVNSGAYPAPQAVEPVSAYPPVDAPASDQPWAPQAADAAWSRDQATIESKDVLTMESMPPQFSLTLKGNLPTPCHQLRVSVQAPDAENHIEVEVYSVIDPNLMCAQVLGSFETHVPLTGLSAGKYIVLVNGEQAGEIEVP